MDGLRTAHLICRTRRFSIIATEESDGGTGGQKRPLNPYIHSLQDRTACARRSQGQVIPGLPFQQGSQLLQRRGKSRAVILRCNLLGQLAGR